MPAALESISWGELQDAYGPASEIPKLLANVAKARGAKLLAAVDELCAHVLHEGTIYSSSPFVASWLLARARNAGPDERVVFYELLMGFAEAARTVLRNGTMLPYHTGGDPEDALEIRRVILAACPQFSGELVHPLPGVRAAAGELLLAFEVTHPSATMLVIEKYFQEHEASVRMAWLHGMLRIFPRLENADEFLDAALASEDNPRNRFALRQAQICRAKKAATAEMVDELIATFHGERIFFDSVRMLGPQRELAALLQLLQSATEEDVVRVLAERLLRCAFEDQRCGWGATAASILRDDDSAPMFKMYNGTPQDGSMRSLRNLLPFLRRREPRHAERAALKGVRNIDYYAISGVPPEIQPTLRDAQRDVLLALAAKTELWQFQTNLWDLFGLPARAPALTAFAQERSRASFGVATDSSQNGRSDSTKNARAGRIAFRQIAQTAAPSGVASRETGL